jgi:rhodanese-related sulfurtransferase
VAHEALDERGLPTGYIFKPELELTPRDAIRMLREGKLLLIDCRTQPEFEFDHVDGSVHIPLDDIERRASEVEPQPGQQVAVICHHGVRSLRATHALRALGVPGCLSVAGGIDAWSLGADSSVKRYERSGGVIRSM